MALDADWNSFCSGVIAGQTSIKECHLFSTSGDQLGSSTEAELMQTDQVTIVLNREDEGTEEKKVFENKYMVETLLKSHNGGTFTIKGQKFTFAPLQTPFEIAEGIQASIFKSSIKAFESGWALCFIRTDGKTDEDDYEGNFGADNYICFLKWESQDKTAEYFQNIYASFAQ